MAGQTEESKLPSRGPASGWRSIQWWPALVGLAFAIYLAVDLFSGAERGADFAAVVAASGLVYLAAAALEIPWISWPVFFGSVVVITLVRLGLVPVDATWMMIAIAGLFAALGIMRSFRHTNRDLPLQALAMLAFGGSAIVALFLSPFAGALLVAAGLFAHAGWDVYHHVRNKVVVRSMAEFCFMLDSVLAIAIVIAAFQNG